MEVTKENYLSLDYFQIFGLNDEQIIAAGGILDQTSSTSIKKMFRKLSLRFHPDKDSSEEARQVFEYLKEAVDVLTDRDRCQAYASRKSARMEEKEVRGHRTADASRAGEVLLEREAASKKAEAENIARDAAIAARLGQGVGARNAAYEELRRGLLSSWEAMEEDMLNSWEVGPEELASKEADVFKMLAKLNTTLINKKKRNRP